MVGNGITWVANKIKDFRRKTWGPNQSSFLPQRAILKNGDYNILRRKMSRAYRWRYLQDIFTSLVDAQWRWTLQFLAVGFFGCWLFFTLVWWLIAFVHGDLQEGHLPTQQEETGWVPCVLNIHGFHSAFLFSLETQHTTGYGLRVITEQCPEAIFILCMQCIIGMIVDTFTLGILAAKMLRPKFAAYTIQFSRNAVICKHEGELCLMFRVGDIRRSRLIGAGIRAILIQNEKTREGHKINNHQTELTIKALGGDENLFLIWPTVIVHPIDKESPFYDMSAKDMLVKKFEIVIILDASVESTGAGIQARTSYVPNEILWSHRFAPMVSYNQNSEYYEVNWKKFDKVFPVVIPMCSAADLEKYKITTDDNSISQNSEEIQEENKKNPFKDDQAPEYISSKEITITSEKIRSFLHTCMDEKNFTNHHTSHNQSKPYLTMKDNSPKPTTATASSSSLTSSNKTPAKSNTSFKAYTQRFENKSSCVPNEKNKNQQSALENEPFDSFDALRKMSTVPQVKITTNDHHFKRHHYDIPEATEEEEENEKLLIEYV